MTAGAQNYVFATPRTYIYTHAGKRKSSYDEKVAASGKKRVYSGGGAGGRGGGIGRGRGSTASKACKPQ